LPLSFDLRTIEVYHNLTDKTRVLTRHLLFLGTLQKAAIQADLNKKGNAATLPFSGIQ